MRRNYLPILILILAVVMMIYIAVDYFMMDAAFNYWLFFIAIIIFFLGLAMRSKSSNK